MQLVLPRPGTVNPDRLRTAARLAASFVVLAAAYAGASWYGGAAPFDGVRVDPYSEASVVQAIPFDAPLPYDLTLISAGRGGQLPYHATWSSALPPDRVGQQVLDHLAGSPKWQLTENKALAGDFTTHLARLSADAQMTHFAELSVRAGEDGGSIVSFDFTPIPTSRAPR